MSLHSQEHPSPHHDGLSKSHDTLGRQPLAVLKSQVVERKQRPLAPLPEPEGGSVAWSQEVRRPTVREQAHIVFTGTHPHLERQWETIAASEGSPLYKTSDSPNL